MQFYSDYSSDEEKGDGGNDLWNPNDLIDEIVTSKNEQDKLKQKKELISRFLEQQRPMLTSRMKDFLVEDGVPETLLSFVSRLNEVPTQEDNSAKKPKVRPLNPGNNEEVIRKSFNVMEIFINPMNDLDSLLQDKLDVVLRELFKIFHANSSGNFHHFNKIMEQLLVRAPVETTQILVSENLLWVMFDYLIESPIVDSVIDIFCCGFPKQSDTIQFYKSLVDAKVFDKIGERIYSKGQLGALYVAEFFIKLLEKLSSFEMSGILFISLCRSSTFVDGLFKVATSIDDTYPFEQRHACAMVLRELLLKSGEKMFEHADYTRPMPNMLSAVHDKLHDHAKAFVVPLVEVLINLDAQKKENAIPFSAFTVKRPFGLYRFCLVEILTDLIICAPEILDKLPQQIWRVLGSWFVEYCHNNLYHSLFYKIIQIIVRENHVESQQALLKQYRFLTRVIEHYRSNDPTDARGFILLIANTLRLGSDLQLPSGWLRHYLLSHDPWKQFLPILRHDTEMQLKRYNDITSDMIDGEEEGFDEDLEIDLGSAYARSLGFEEEAPGESPSPTRKRKPKKKKSKKKKTEEGGVDSDSDSDNEDEDENSTIENHVTEEGTNPQQQQPIPPKHTVSAKEEKIMEEVKQDEVTDPSLSKESWWADLKGELEEQDKSKRESSGSDNIDWWADLKDELSAIEEKN